MIDIPVSAEEVVVHTETRVLVTGVIRICTIQTDLSTLLAWILSSIAAVCSRLAAQTSIQVAYIRADTVHSRLAAFLTHVHRTVAAVQIFTVTQTCVLVARFTGNVAFQIRFVAFFTGIDGAVRAEDVATAQTRAFIACLPVRTAESLLTTLFTGVGLSIAAEDDALIAGARLAEADILVARGSCSAGETRFVTFLTGIGVAVFTEGRRTNTASGTDESVRANGSRLTREEALVRAFIVVDSVAIVALFARIGDAVAAVACCTALIHTSSTATVAIIPIAVVAGFVHARCDVVIHGSVTADGTLRGAPVPIQ